jgi:hypothetical protein
MVADLYQKWHPYLQGFLDLEEAFFQSICFGTASVADYIFSLERLSNFLARKSGRKTMVFINEYDTPFIRADEHNFSAEVRPSSPPDYGQD